MTQGRAPAAVRVRSWASIFYTGGGSGDPGALLPLIIVFVAAFTKTSGPVMHWGSWPASMQRALHGAPEPIPELAARFAGDGAGRGFAVLVSYLTIKRSAYTQALDYIVVLPLTISGTVLGIALVQTFNTGWLVLAGTSAIMVLCYTVRRLLPSPCATPRRCCSTSPTRSKKPRAWACRR